MRIKNIKLSTKLIISVCLAGVVATPLLGYMFFNSARTFLVDSIQKDQLDETHRTMAKIDRIMFGANKDIQLIATELSTVDELETHKNNTAAESKVFRDVLHDVLHVELETKLLFTGPWRKLSVVDINGTVIESTIDEDIGTVITHDPDRKIALQSALKGGTYSSDLVRVGPAGKATVVLSAPIRREDIHGSPILGVVIGELEWYVVLQLLDEYDPHNKVHLLNRNKMVIAAPSRNRDAILQKSCAAIDVVQEAFQGGKQSFTVHSTTDEGTPSLLSFVRQKGLFSYEGNGWALMNEVTLDRVYGPIRKMSEKLMILVLFIMMAIAVFIYIIGRKLTRPIESLTATVQSLAAGNFDVRAEVTTTDEIGTLAESFNKMVEDLQNTTVTKDYVDNIIRSMIETLLVVSPDGKIIRVNTAACHLLEYEEKELVGQPVEIIFEDESPLRQVEEERDLSQFSGHSVEMNYVSKSGRKIPVIFSTAILHDQNNKMQGLVCVARDITERIEAEEELAEAQKQLVDSAHKAGMADIATGILHNLGNVLNSANSSAEEITQIVRTSKVGSFINANQLLEENMDHIGEFLSTDQKGSKLPGFYLKLGNVLKEENSRVAKSMKRIEDKISTMKGIIETQQEYAKAEFHSEKEELPKIINDVLKIQKDLIQSNGVHIKGDYEKPLRCKMHKYKLVQVLINLVKNAVESMKGNDVHNRTKELKIETGRIDDGKDFIRLIDNGCGIPPENLIKIFNHGFTTKEKGHGFGLHASANAMTEMGGSITVESDGENKGAVFMVQLPVEETMYEGVLHEEN